MTSRRQLLGAALTAPLMLSACGFRLRGAYSTPFKTIYLQMPKNSRITNRIAQELQAGSDVVIVNSANEADAILELLSNRRGKDELTFNDVGEVREYELTITMEFRVMAPNGHPYMEATRLQTHRTISYSDTKFLSRAKEYDFIYRDMEADLINQLMRHIEAIKPLKGL